MADKEKKIEMPQTVTEEKEVKKEVVLERVKKEIEKLKTKGSRFYFYVIDTKGVPSGSLLYIYKIAQHLHSEGYDVTMLHAEKDFVGVSEWAEKKYAELKHDTIENKRQKFSPADFLFIPDIYTEIMSQTKNMPCKRVIIFQNDEYFTRFIPLGVSPYKYGITDAIVNSENNKEWFKANLQHIKTHLIRPGISSTMFRKPEKPRRLIVNFVCKDGNDASRIVKPFMWKYPNLKWVTFAQLGNLPQNVFADALRDGIITIWIDDDCSFGYAPLEALKTGSIVIGKIPQRIPDWAKTEDGGITDSVIWFDDFSVVPDLLARLIGMWIKDEVPEDVYDAIKPAETLNTKEVNEGDIDKVINDFIDTRLKEFEGVLEKINKEIEEEK